jgi:hypothetical protein
VLVRITSIITIILMIKFVLNTYFIYRAYEVANGFIDSVLKINSRANLLATDDIGQYLKKKNVLKDFINFKVWTFNQYIQGDYKITLVNIITKRSEEYPDSVIMDSSKESV